MLRNVYEKKLAEYQKLQRWDLVSHLKLEAQREGIVDLEDMKAQRAALDEQIKKAEVDEAT